MGNLGTPSPARWRGPPRISAFCGFPMGQKKYLWYLGMALAAFNMGNFTLVIGFPMAKTTCMPNFSFPAPHRGLEDEPVVLGGAPGHVHAPGHVYTPGHVRYGVDHLSPGPGHPHFSLLRSVKMGH